MTTDGWRSYANVRQDLGAAVLARDGDGRGLEDEIGAREIAFDRSRKQQYTAFGYPALPNALSTPPRLEFDGERQWSCDSPVTGSDAVQSGAGPETLQIDCDMTGGSSGGGWVNADGAVNGLVSYGYVGDGNHLYGPYFGSFARELYERASGPPLACAGRQVTNLGNTGAQTFTGTGEADVFK